MADQTLSTQLIKAFVPNPEMYELTQVEETDTEIRLYLKSRKTEEKCPECGEGSGKFKKKYTRRVKYDSYGGKKVILIIEVHSFKCLNEKCGRKTFSEDLPFAQKWQQRSDRLNRQLITEMAQSGFRGAAKSKELADLKVSYESLRRLFSRIVFEESGVKGIEVVGIDDCALKSGHKYMTQISMLEEDTIKLLRLAEGRTGESLKAFLTEYPGIKFVARDRSSAYSGAIKKYLVGAVEVADRFHLIQNSIERIVEYLKPKLPRSFRFEAGELARTGVEEMQRQEKQKKLNRQAQKAKAVKTKDNDGNNYTPAEPAPAEKDVKTLKRKDLLKLVCRKSAPDGQTRQLLKTLMRHYPCIKTAREFWEDFYRVIMGEDTRDLPDPKELDDFTAKYEKSDFKSFVKSIQKDREAVRNAIIHRFISSGKVEGLNNKIKLIKRKGYGNYDLETLEKMIKLSYEYYHGSIDELELKPVSRKSYETKKSKNKEPKVIKFESWFDEEHD